MTFHKSGNMKKCIIGLAIMAITGVACLTTANDRQCLDLNWDQAQTAVLFGKATAAGKILLTAKNQQAYLICGEQTHVIKEQQGHYILARGRLLETRLEAALPFRIDTVLYITADALPDWSEAELITISGLLEKGIDDRITIVTNWNSRSRISHYVLGKYREELQAQAGQYVQVSCYLIRNLNDPNPWSRDIIVSEIIKISAEAVQ